MKDRVRGFSPRNLFQGASLQNKMVAMLLVIVLQSMVFTGIIVVLSNLYLQNFNTVMNDCYDINQMLTAYTAEADLFQAYVLERSEQSYADYLASRMHSNRVLEQVDITFDESRDQFLLFQAVENSFASFRAACDETVFKRLANSPYADAYDRALRIGQYIDTYIKNLLQMTIGQGQELYQVNITQFRLLPLLFMLSIFLSLLCIGIWTRWMFKRVVSPINDLIRVAGDMSENQYDTPDVMVYKDDEIAQLARVVNEMKHSTAQLVDSLRVQREIENRLHTEEMRRVRAESTMDTLRLSLLQSQINPHFLFNTLNIISRMAQMEEAPVTEELIVRLANLFRYNLRSVDDIVPLENELKIVEDYIAIQQIRFGERIGFSLVCDLNPAEYMVPVFTMQPLIENAVIHGISPMEEGGRVEVRITREADELVIIVQDTGVGMSPEQVQTLLQDQAAVRQHVSGLGVGNVKGRIEAHYPDGSFTIQSSLECGTTIRIAIPVKTEGISDEIPLWRDMPEAAPDKESPHV